MISQTTQNLHGADLSPFERVGPECLQRYLLGLDELNKPEKIWGHFLSYCHSLGVRYVTYGLSCQTVQSESELVMISNLPAEWRQWTESLEGSEHLTFVRSFHLKRLTSLVLGIEFNDEIKAAGLLTPEHEAVTRKAAEIGWRAGFALALRSSCEGEKGSMSFGTGLTKAEFEDFLSANGWALSMAGSLTHLAYLRALKRDQCRDIELTNRQLEFLKLSSIGMETKEIAYEWGKSEQAVTKTRRTVIRKLAVSSKMAAVAKATRLDLIQEPSWRAGDPLNATWDYGFKTQPLEVDMSSVNLT